MIKDPESGLKSRNVEPPFPILALSTPGPKVCKSQAFGSRRYRYVLLLIDNQFFSKDAMDVALP